MTLRHHPIRYSILPAVLLTFACGGGGGGDQAEGGTAAADAIQVDPATAGRVVGTISFEGQPPAPQPIDMNEEPTCAQKHEGRPMQQVAIVGPDGGLKNVFVHVKEGLPEGSWPARTEAVVLDQEGCVYEPHVLAVQVGQPVEIKNSDGLLHNVNARPDNQRGFNISQPTNMSTTRTFSAEEIMVPVQCDVHGWMEAYIGVTDHPYHAVTAENGSFTIANLPPGDYVIETWHEEYGTQTQNVTVPASGEARADFRYSASMAGSVVPLGEPIDPHGQHAVASAGH